MDKKIFIAKIVGYALMFYSFFSMLVGMLNEEPISTMDIVTMMTGFLVMSIINYVQHKK